MNKTNKTNRTDNMDDSDILEIHQGLLGLFEELEESSSVTFKYAKLAEIEKFIENQKDVLNIADKITVFLDAAYAYYGLGHYLYAKKNYEKAFKLLSGCTEAAAAKILENNRDMQGDIEYHLGILLEIYKNMGKEKETAVLLGIVKRVMPYSAGKIKINKSALKRDPVEYTEKYLEILPKLEAKIEKKINGWKGFRGKYSRYDYDSIKKEMLRKNYGIEWQPPQELNP